MQRTLAVVYLITRAQCIQAITLAREHLPRQRQAIGDFTESIGFRDIAVELAELIIHKADIKRRVMNDQFRPADIIEKFIRHFGKCRLVQQELIRNTVDAERFRIHQPIRLQIDMEVIPRQAAVHHLYSTDLNDLVPFVVRADLVHTGGFGIEDDLSCNCSAHSGHLCQTCRFTVRFNYRKSTRDA